MGPGWWGVFSCTDAKPFAFLGLHHNVMVAVAAGLCRSYTFSLVLGIAHNTCYTWQNQYVQSIDWVLAKFCKENVEWIAIGIFLLLPWLRVESG
jgi:hypothetical protein